MMRRAPFALFPSLSLLALLSLISAGCEKADPQERLKVLIGETVIAEPGAQPIDDAIVVIAGSKIRSVGARKDVPVPQNSDRTELDGKWVLPAPGGKIERGEVANLLIVDRAPTSAASPGSPSDIGAQIVAGEWKTK